MIRRSGCAQFEVMDGARSRIAGMAFAAFVLSVAAVAAVAAEDEVMAPGSAKHAPSGATRVESIAPHVIGTTIEAEGLYSYITPFAPPRWLRLQQTGATVWGMIDINDSFGLCTRTRLDGSITDDVVTFNVPLIEADCPCSGAGAYLTFVGVVDTSGSIVGTWNNNCSPFGGQWIACGVPDTTGPGNGTEPCPLPDNSPPSMIRQTPAGGVWWWGLLATGLTVLALASLKRRVPRPMGARP